MLPVKPLQRQVAHQRVAGHGLREATCKRDPIISIRNKKTNGPYLRVVVRDRMGEYEITVGVGEVVQD